MFLGVLAKPLVGQPPVSIGLVAFDCSMKGRGMRHHVEIRPNIGLYGGLSSWQSASCECGWEKRVRRSEARADARQHRLQHLDEVLDAGITPNPVAVPSRNHQRLLDDLQVAIEEGVIRPQSQS